MRADGVGIAPDGSSRSGAAPERASEGTRVVAEVAHALRNHFHRLYYWMDVVGEAGLADEGRAALEAAGTTVRAVERLTSGVMDLSRDLDLARIAMDAGEIVHYVGQSLLRQGAALRVESGDLAGTRVAVDPSHVSRTIEILGARLGAAPGREAPIDLHAEVDDEGWLVLTLHASEATDPADGEVERLLEWAQAERVVRGHGGRLVWEAAGEDEHRAVLLLPAIA